MAHVVVVKVVESLKELSDHFSKRGKQVLLS